jgi:hypothetical protein
LPLLMGLLAAAAFCVLFYKRGWRFEATGTLSVVGYTFLYFLIIMGMAVIETVLLLAFRDILKRKACRRAIWIHLTLVLVLVGIGPAMGGMLYLGRRAAWEAVDLSALAAAAKTMPALLPAGETSVTISAASMDYGTLPEAVRDVFAPVYVKITRKAIVLQKVGESYGDTADGVILPLVALREPAEAFARRYDLQVLSEKPLAFRHHGHDIQSLPIPELDLNDIPMRP